VWIKKTAAEIADGQQKKRRQRVQSAMLFAILTTVPMIFIFGFWQAAESGRMLVPLRAIPGRVLTVLPVGIILGILYYALLSRKIPVMICPKCGASKNRDSVATCECGGMFENLDTMKWVE